MGNCYFFLRLSSRIFRHSGDFLANFRKNSWVVDVCIVLLAFLLMLVQLLSSLYYFWHPCCGGPPFCCWPCDGLIPLLLLASLHAVANFTVFASIPAFLVSILCWRSCVVFIPAVACMVLLSFLMLLVAGATVVLVSLLLLAFRLWQAFLLFLSSFKFLMVSCCWSLCYCWGSGVANGVVGVWAVPFEHVVAGGPAVTGFPAVDGVLDVASAPADPGVPILAGGFTYWIVEWDLLHYQTIGL